ncbi:MAG: FHA domain-containing protein, partial [Planctomycetota bacterium]
MPTLRVARGRSTAEEFRFSGEMRIGRAEECEVRVFDEAASRCHAIVKPEGADYVALDQRSLNGLFVNGKKVDRHVLRTGDEITVRNLTLVFVADGAAERPTVVGEPLKIESRIAEPLGARVGGAEEELLARLAAVYRFADVLRAPRVREGIARAVEEVFSPCRAALVLPDGDVGVFARSVVDHARGKGVAILVKEPRVDLPGASSLATGKILSAMAAPIESFGALYADRTSGDPFRPDELEL